MSDDRVRRIFSDALDRPTAVRDSFLADACGTDAALRSEVESLLAHHVIEIGGSLDRHGPMQCGDFIGPYKVLSTLGEGGFGIVYLAEQTSPFRRRVAVKVIKAGMDSRRILARFDVERQALAIMDHAGIAKVFDSGITEQGLPFFAMEYVKGTPITESCDRHRLTIIERLSLMADVCDAVHHAHTKGVIHRDLKPANVLVQTDDNIKLMPRIIDFGVAKATSLQLTDMTLVTSAGQILGTPAYMSPEQADSRGCDIDTRSDIYALGIMLYEVLSGQPPFLSSELGSGGLADMQRVICEQAPPKPSTRFTSLEHKDGCKIAAARRIGMHALAGTLRKELDWIPLKAIRKAPGDRYHSARSMAVDIRRYIAGKPLEAGPESAMYRLRKSVHRNKGTWLAGTMIVLLLITVTCVSLVLWQRARSHAVAAKQHAAELIRSQRAWALSGSHLGNSLVHQLQHQHTDAWRSVLDQHIKHIVAETPDDPITRIELLAKLAGEQPPKTITDAVASIVVTAWQDANAALESLESDFPSDDQTLAGRLALANLKIIILLKHAGQQDLGDIEGAAQSLRDSATLLTQAEGLGLLAQEQLQDHNVKGIATARQAVALLEDLPRSTAMRAKLLKKLAWYHDQKGDREQAVHVMNDEVLPLYRTLYKPGDIQLRMAEHMMVWSTPDEQITPDLLVEAQEFIEALRLKYGENHNHTWQQMNNLALLLTRYAVIQLKAGDAAASRQAELDAAALFDHILQAAATHNPVDIENYMTNYKSSLPEYAPTPEDWERWWDLIQDIPSRRP